MADRSPIDIIVYNIPQFSNEISLAVLKRLVRDCPRIVGIKDSSRDMPRFMDTLNLLDALEAFGGFEPTIIAFSSVNRNFLTFQWTE